MSWAAVCVGSVEQEPFVCLLLANRKTSSVDGTTFAPSLCASVAVQWQCRQASGSNFGTKYWENGGRLELLGELRLPASVVAGTADDRFCSKDGCKWPVVVFRQFRSGQRKQQRCLPARVSLP